MDVSTSVCGRVHFKVVSYHLSERRQAGGSGTCEATIKVDLGGSEPIHRVAEGCGPVNAMDRALRKAIGESYPYLVRGVEIFDYRVNIVGQGGSAAKTHVIMYFKMGDDTWRSEGIHESLTEASLMALVTGFNNVPQTVEAKV